jgi:hypothetical protein
MLNKGGQMEEEVKVVGGPSSMARASLILGIVSIIPFIGSAAGLAAIILGIIDLVKISNGQAPEAGKKFDIIGIILGVVLQAIGWAIVSAIIVACAAGAAALGY